MAAVVLVTDVWGVGLWYKSCVAREASEKLGAYRSLLRQEPVISPAGWRGAGAVRVLLQTEIKISSRLHSQSKRTHLVRNRVKLRPGQLHAPGALCALCVAQIAHLGRLLAHLRQHLPPRDSSMSFFPRPRRTRRASESARSSAASLAAFTRARSEAVVS
jgi:hypothetical protein